MTMEKKIILCAFTRVNLGVRQLCACLRSAGFDAAMQFVEDPDHTPLDALLSADVVGISIVTEECHKAARLAGRILAGRRGARPLVVLGGVHPTIKPLDCLAFCDCIVRGEGEGALLDICSDPASFRSVQNVSYVADGKIVHNELRPLVQDLDRYPFMLYNDLSCLERYMIITSRGCPFACTYCYNNYLRRFYRGKGCYLRKRSIGNVIEELEFVKARSPRLNLVQIFDDNFIARPLAEIAEFSAKYNNKIGIPFYCLANPNLIVKKKISLLRDAGLMHVQMGIQSGSDRINRFVYKRRVDRKKILDCVNLLHELGISAYYDIIFNNPYESVGDVRDTFRLLNEFPRPFHLQGHNLIFYPCTELTERALADGYITELPKDEVNEKALRGNLSSPLLFEDSLDNSFYKVHYATRGKVRLNHLITLTQILPRNLVRLLSWWPGDVRWLARLCLHLKRDRSFREEHFYRLLSKGQRSPAECG